MIIFRHHPTARFEPIKHHKSAFKAVVGKVGGTLIGNMIAPGIGGTIGGMIGSAVAGGGGSGGSGAVASGYAIEPPRTFYNALYGTRVREVKTQGGTEMVQDVIYSPEDKARLDELEQIRTNMLADIEYLSSVSSAYDIPEFQPVIQAQAENQRIAREDAFKRVSNIAEDTLAKRGIEDSTSAVQLRDRIAENLTKQAAQDQRDLTLQAEQLRADALNRAGTQLTFADTSIRQDKQDRAASLAALSGQQLNWFGQTSGNATNQAQYGFTAQGFNNTVAAARAQEQARLAEQIGMGLGGLKTGAQTNNSPYSFNSGAYSTLNNGTNIFWN